VGNPPHPTHAAIRLSPNKQLAAKVAHAARVYDLQERPYNEIETQKGEKIRKEPSI
jgi:hypothetical protein